MYLQSGSTRCSPRALRFLLPALVALASLTLLPTAGAAPSAVTRYVTTTGNDFGNASCSVTAPCSTIKYAIAISDPGDTIKIGPGSFKEYSINIDKDLIVKGDGIRNTVVNAQHISSVFIVSAGVTAKLKNMRIRNGSAPTLSQGGGIHNLGKLTVTSVTLLDNIAQTGGAIFNQGTLNLKKSNLYRNMANGFGGGLYNHPDGTALLTQVNVQLNTANAGGGIANAGSLLLFHSAVHQTLDGGGITNQNTAVLLNVTISGNANPGTAGAGIGVISGTVDLHYVTMSSNSGLAIAITRGAATIQKSIIYGNNASQAQCQTTASGSYSDGGHNVFADTTCGYHPWTASIVTNPKIKPLAYNNSPTPTHALKPASPAIDLVAPKHCTPIDQRGVKRPVEGDGVGKAKCDAGAHEYP